MIKRLARFILKKDIEKSNESVDRLISANLNLRTQVDRLSEIINKYSAERVINEQRDVREYVFSPQSLTGEEQLIVGKFVGNPLMEMLTKWFKSRADQNNDMLIHNTDATDEKKALWRIAVLVYEDWYMFVKNCGQMYEKSLKTKGTK